MTVIGVIPARWGSTRFEGKVLADVLGKPMLQHVWERAAQSSLLSNVLIACDDERIVQAAQEFKARVVLTPRDCLSGTDRIAAAVKDIEADIVVNIQGDEPLIDPVVIDSVARVLRERPDVPVATAIHRIQAAEDIENPNVVKAVIDHRHHALYFSRAAIPYLRDLEADAGPWYYRHIGIYAYRRDFLLAYPDLKPSRLEKAERLEQLRILEAGYQIATVETDYHPRGVDTPQDLKDLIAFMESNP